MQRNEAMQWNDPFIISIADFLPCPNPIALSRPFPNLNRRSLPVIAAGIKVSRSLCPTSRCRHYRSLPAAAPSSSTFLYVVDTMQGGAVSSDAGSSMMAGAICGLVSSSAALDEEMMVKTPLVRLPGLAHKVFALMPKTIFCPGLNMMFPCSRVMLWLKKRVPSSPLPWLENPSLVFPDIAL